MKSLAITLTLLGALALSLPLHLSGQDEKPKKAPPAKEAEKPESPKGKKPRPPKTESPVRQQTPPSHPAKVEKKNTRTWVGIMTSPVSLPLREHLEIEAGFGIQVHEVVKDSPAGKAGLRRHDILLQFNDQLLTSPEHLSLLVRREKPESKANFTLIRVGKKEILTVTLGESEDAPRIHAFSRGPGSAGGRPTSPMTARGGTPEHLKQRHEEWRQHRERHQQSHQGAPVKAVSPTKRPESRPPAVSVKPGFPVNIMGYHGVVKIDNDNGDVTITRKDDKHFIGISDEDGKSVYDGPYDPEKGTEGLPKPAQEQLKHMKLDDLKLLTPGAKTATDAAKKADAAKDGKTL